MQSFDIQVFNKKSGQWQHRATVEAAKSNDALRTYLPSVMLKRDGATRPYTQDGVTYATNAKGKRFRAISEIVPA